MFKRNPITQTLSKVLQATSFYGTVIKSITAEPYTLTITIILPPNKELSDLQLILPNIQQSLNALDIKITKTTGKQNKIVLGMRDLTTIPYHSSLLHPGTLKIELPSSYGSSILDFSNGASCHLLNGGGTRMGKTTLWYYLCTCLYLQNKDSIQFLICSTKSEDFYPFQGIPGFTITDDHTEVFNSLDNFIALKNHRKSLLRTIGNVKDHNGVRQRYPHLYPQFHPIFIVIDEYGSYSDNQPIQKQVTELVERGGSYNIHCILAAQRPDARTVLPARIKANLLTRICFTTSDSNNSIVILDKEGAENLGGIPGRAIFQDGEQNIIQVPYLSDEECEKIMKPFRKEVIRHESNQSQEGCSNPDLTNKIQNLFKESTSIHPF